MKDDLVDRIREYWNRQPCNVRHSDAPIGSEQYFHDVTRRRYHVEPHALDFAGFHLWRGRRVLEIGCGIGTDAEQFARHGADYVGIDLSSASVNICRQRFDIFGLTGQFHVMDAADSAALSGLGKFDLVYSYGVIHHYPDLDRVLNNIHSVQDSGGEFRFLVYAKNSWKYAMIQKGLDQFEAQADCPYARAFTKEEIYDVLGDRWQIERIRQDHCFMYNVAAYKQGRYELEPWFANMDDAMKQAVREYLGWHLLVKAKKP